MQLARENSFDVFVEANDLVFQPAGLDIDFPVYISKQAVTGMRFEKTLAIPSGATATVQSWNSRDKTSYSSDLIPYDGSGQAADIAPQLTESSSTQPFLFSAANFTSQQVSAYASRFAAELNRLGVVASIEMPWDLSLSPRRTILLDDTQSALDRSSKIDTIERHYSANSGSTQIIRAIAT